MQVLTVGLLASGNLRNWPPASEPCTAVSPNPMVGDFGPNAVNILRLVASGGNGQPSFDNGDNITVYFSELSNCAGLPEVFYRVLTIFTTLREMLYYIPCSINEMCGFILNYF